MTSPEDNVPVRMIRPHLRNLPVHPVPPGYRIRAYRPGDEHAWVAIQTAADRYNTIDLDLFHRQFGREPGPLSARQLFLLDAADHPIGTCTAWQGAFSGPSVRGRVHWLAILPDLQGRGLSKPMLSRTCLRLRELGHDTAYLTTSTARIAAINLYWAFGFRPDIRAAEDRKAWARVDAIRAEKHHANRTP